MKPIGNIVGKRKYQALKALDLKNITDETLRILEVQFNGLTVAEALKMIDNYENFSPNEYNRKSVKEYFDKIRNPENKKRRTQQMTKEWLWKEFTKAFLQNEKVKFDATAPEVVENIKPLIYYFLGEIEEFKKCQNVSFISEPSLRKGLLIIGGYGCGKTSIMNALELALRPTNIRFKGYTANQIVTMFEACSSPMDKEDFYRKTRTGTVYFDDVLTEREASNYGKHNLFKEIIEERYSQRRRTYISCNYQDGTDNDLKIGLAQFGEKYGSRVYDRLFEMFNVIEFEGKSFRK